MLKNRTLCRGATLIAAVRLGVLPQLETRVRVLIVEDEPDVALVIEDIAMAEGFEVVGIATRATEAIELAHETDLAIVDVRLSDGLSGPKIAQALATGFGVGVVFLTGNPELVDGIPGINVVDKQAGSEGIAKALKLAAISHSKGTA